MGIGSSSEPHFGRCVPKHARKMKSCAKEECMIQLRNQEDFLPMCAFLHKSGVEICAIDKYPCRMWIKKSPTFGQLCSENKCGTFDLVPSAFEEKGTHCLTLDNNMSYYDMENMRNEFANQGMFATAQSPPTNLGQKTIFFTAM